MMLPEITEIFMLMTSKLRFHNFQRTENRDFMNNKYIVMKKRTWRIVEIYQRDLCKYISYMK